MAKYPAPEGQSTDLMPPCVTCKVSDKNVKWTGANNSGWPRHLKVDECIAALGSMVGELRALLNV